MNRDFIIAVILVLSSCFLYETNAFNKTGSCHYFSDPHLEPFPAQPGMTANMYICRPNCTEILIRNDFLEIYVTSRSTAGKYFIVEYTMVFFPTKKYSSPCVITANVDNPSISSLTCPSGSPADSFGSGPQRHYFHLTKNIKVDIEDAGTFYNILITQSFHLIAQSTGICINWDCELEYSSAKRKKRQIQSSDSIISQVCSIFINSAQGKITDGMNKNLIEAQRVACEYDLNTTRDPRCARHVVTSILRDSVNKYENDDNFQDRLLEIDALTEETIKQANQDANNLIQQSGFVCQSDTDQNQCLQLIDDTK
ncbi:unnamed protein product [Adineta steineri]|uniref:Uncharacterized protein n=1 Tax=Adineta steineri TaxID=433720 RepID=A0A815N4R8_9BILA|nr:unnamed protein product [Adineta steineri]